MAAFKGHKSKDTTKMLVCGGSGAGKTGGLATLVNAGYRVCVADFDDGMDILWNYVESDKLDNLHYITFADDLEKKTSAFGQFQKVLKDGWKDDEEDLGRIQDWGPDTVFVLDTLTFFGEAAKRVVLGKKGKALDAQLELQEWGEAMRMVESKVAELCSNSIKCNVIMNTHLKPVEDDSGRSSFLPSSVGSSLSGYIGRYFNTVVRIDTKTKPQGVEQVVRTQSDSKMNLKTSAPSKFKIEEDFNLANIIERVKEAAREKANQ